MSKTEHVADLKPPLPKLLVVEDDTSFASMLSLELKRAGYAVHTETNGDNASVRLSKEF